jgi:hypothetical protein
VTIAKQEREPEKGDLVRVAWPSGSLDRIGIVLSVKVWYWPSPRLGGDPYVRGSQVTVMLGTGEMLVLTPKQLEVITSSDGREDG